MTPQHDDEFDTLMTGWFASKVGTEAPAGLFDTTLARTERTKPLPAWRIPARWLPGEALLRPRGLTPTLVLLGALVLVAIVALLGLAGRQRLPAPTGVAAPGMVAYVADGHIWTAARDGSGAVQVTDDARVDMGPTWSPDGTKLAFRRLPREGAVDDWSHQGDILVFDLASRAVRPIDEGTRTPSEISWSPDSRAIAYSRVTDKLDQVFIASLDGSAPRQVTHGDRSAFAPAWSPDGTTLAYALGTGVAREIQHEPLTVDGIWVITTAGTDARKLTTRPMEDANTIAWSPDGRTIFFGTGDREDRQIWRVGSDGRPEELVAQGSDLSVSPDGTRLAFLRTGDAFATTVWVCDVDGSAARTISAEGHWRAPRWSPDGKHIVATDDRLFEAPTLVVLDPSGAEAPVTYELPAERIGVGRADAPTWQRVAPP